MGMSMIRYSWYLNSWLLFPNLRMVLMPLASPKAIVLQSFTLNFELIHHLGGQFLRAYLERYNSPSINNLITFGSQHMGISDIPACRPYDLLCQVARRAAKSAVYGKWAQENLVQVRLLSSELGLYERVHLRLNIFEIPRKWTHISQPTNFLPRSTTK